jgi:hypothetical protein
VVYRTACLRNFLGLEVVQQMFYDGRIDHARFAGPAALCDGRVVGHAYHTASGGGVQGATVDGLDLEEYEPRGPCVASTSRAWDHG